MKKKDKIQIILTLLSFILAPFFTWLFNYFSDTINPIIIFYATISTILSIVFSYILVNIIIFLYIIISQRIQNLFYWKEINKSSKYLENELKSKEMYVIFSKDLAQYVNRRFYVEKKTPRSISITSEILSSTTDIINNMINKAILVYIQSLGIVLLREILKCKNCNEEIKVYDKVDSIDIRCNKCNEQYFINRKGFGFIEESDIFTNDYILLCRMKNPNVKLIL